jgi:hypothetical protein
MPGIGVRKAPAGGNSKRMTTELIGLLPVPFHPSPFRERGGTRTPGIDAPWSRQYRAPPLSALDRDPPRDPSSYSGVAGPQLTSLSHASQSPRK